MEPLEAFYKSISKYFNLLMTVTAVSFILLVYPKGIDYNKPLEELYELKNLEIWYLSNADVGSILSNAIDSVIYNSEESFFSEEFDVDLLGSVPTTITSDEIKLELMSYGLRGDYEFTGSFITLFFHGIETVVKNHGAAFAFTFHIKYGSPIQNRSVSEWFSFFNKNEVPFIPIPVWESINYVDSVSEKSNFFFVSLKTIKNNDSYTFKIEGFSNSTAQKEEERKGTSFESKGSVIATIDDFEPYYLRDLRPLNWVNLFENDTKDDFFSFFEPDRLPVFPALRTVQSLIGDQNIDNAITTLQEKRDEANKISLLGISVSFYPLFIFIPILLLYINSFLFTHLRQLNQILKITNAGFVYPWFGTYSAEDSRSFSVFLIVILPAAVSIGNYIKYFNFITGWLNVIYVMLTIVLFIIGLKVEKENINLRENANPNSPPH